MNRVFIYIDDNESIVKAFADAVRKKWSIDNDVITNKTFGKIDDIRYEDFKAEVVGLIKHNEARIDCIFLDLDYSGGMATDASDNIGFIIGQTIRRTWPAIPIVIASRFTQTEMLQKGIVFDFDGFCDSTQLVKMNVEQFTGLVQLAEKKRKQIIDSIGDIPISFTTGKNRYLKKCDIKIKKKPYIFAAMPFDKNIVSNDVWEVSIKGAAKKSGYGAERVDNEKRSISIIDKISTLIFDADLVVADITGWNANVLYELGIAHASNKACILISQEDKDKLEIPFDVRHIKTLEYKKNELHELTNELILAIKEWVT